VEMEELHACVAGVEEEHAADAEELATLVVEASNTLVDLGMLPIREVPQISKKTQEVLKAMGCHPGVPTRGACHQRWSLGLDSGRLPLPWPGPSCLSFFSFFCIDMNTCIY
jgi:hypothetical protein